MSMTDDILSQISMPELATRLGTDEATAREAAETALPVLLAGVTGDAANPARRDALVQAAQQDHDPAVLDGANPLATVDEAEGDRILDHVLRGQRSNVEGQLQGLFGGKSELVSKVLRLLAPIVMAWLAKRLSGAGSSEGGPAGSGGIGDILGDVLGGATAGGQGSGGGLGDVIGDVLGGGSGGSSESGGGLGDVLGGVLSGSDSSGDAGGEGAATGLGDILGQIGGKSESGGGLDDLIGQMLGGRP